MKENLISYGGELVLDKVKINGKMLSDIIESKEKCINCKLCYKECPMMDNFCKSPRDLMGKIIDDGEFDKLLPYSCMLCNKCSKVCPKGVDLKSVFYDMRKDMFLNHRKELNSIGYKIVKYHQKSSFVPIFSSKVKQKSVKRVFIPGCSLSSYSNEIVYGAYNYLKNIFDNIELVVKCCGKPTLDVGDSVGFKNYYSQIDRIIQEKNVEEVIVACSNCYKTIKNNSPNVKVKMIWEVIHEYGLPSNLKDFYKDLDIKFALHDPCPIKEEDNVHNSVREVLNYLGVSYVEFDKNRRNTECCGYGAMVGVFNNELAIKQMNKRANSVDTQYIISYCESCVEAMLMAKKNSLHVLDFIFNRDILNKKCFSQSLKSFSSKWVERYKAAKIES